MPKLKTKSYLKKRVSQTASGLFKTGRAGHNHFLRHKSKRSNVAGRKTQYLDETKVAQAKILAPYGLKK
jgi:ribosomal protein L35